jgi:hypothetical protein
VVEVWFVVGAEVGSEVGIVAIVGVDRDKVVAVDGKKAAFAAHIVVDWEVDPIERYTAASGMIDCIGEGIFYMDPQGALRD